MNNYTIKYTRIYTRDILATDPLTARHKLTQMLIDDKKHHKLDRLSEYQQFQVCEVYNAD